jgi:hypothetical protein
MAAAYERTHLLVHTGVRPTGAFFRRVRRRHRRHRRSERHSLGFTLPWVDRWLATEPDPRAVPRAKAARYGATSSTQRNPATTIRQDGGWCTRLVTRSPAAP